MGSILIMMQDEYGLNEHHAYSIMKKYGLSHNEMKKVERERECEREVELQETNTLSGKTRKD